nr:limbic system-associated membrane protein-like isoform X2 [Parasteatoda tepidariorum]
MLSTSSHLKVIEGSSVLLPCNALNTAETDVRMWRILPSRLLFSGFISVSSDPKISLADKSSLHIVNITQEYSGEYLCSFFRKPHLKVLHNILVLVPPSISADPSHGKVIEQRGNPTKMICHANGVPKPSITWTYQLPNETHVTSLPSGVHQVDESQLQVASVDSHQAGHYRCTADNEIGHPAIADFNLTVLYAPEVVVRPDWIHGDEGATVELVCTCRSAPLSQLVWMKGDPKHERYLHTDDDRIKIREKMTLPTMAESWLKIQRMRREDLGSYTCLGKNAVGQVWKTVEISGLAEPIQIRGTASGEDSFLLLWTAKSYSPIIEYQMKIRKYKDGDGWTDVMIPVDGDAHSIFYSQSYNVTGLVPDQRYEVVLQAHNDFGWNRPSESLFFGSGEETFEEPDTQNVIFPTSSNYDTALDVTNPAYLSKGSFMAIDWIFFLFTTASGLWQQHIM